MHDSEDLPRYRSDAVEVDQVCNEFQAAWSSGKTIDLLSFVSRVDSSLQETLLRRLLAIDIEYRRRQTPRLRCTDYARLGSVAVQIAAEILANEEDRSEANAAMNNCSVLEETVNLQEPAREEPSPDQTCDYHGSAEMAALERVLKLHRR